jgi:glycosyltransferase involved in cell wall biosynthesis
VVSEGRRTLKRPDAPLHELRAAVWKNALPHIAIVTILYRKADVVTKFLQRVCCQSYAGPITVVLVNDCSPDGSVAEVERFIAGAGSSAPPNVRFKLLQNDTQLGNCGSRNRGLAAVEADVYVIIDCDCLINRDFVAAHAFEHSVEPTDVVIGPLNIESGGREAEAVVAELEAHPSRVSGQMNLQDGVQPNGFVNCITRNFSLKRRYVENGPLFDEDFSYSSKPGSGFGWEDVELGCRLYGQGAHIVFTGKAFSVHQTHPSSMAEADKVRGSAKNLNLLLRKHPELAIAARRWSLWADCVHNSACRRPTSIPTRWPSPSRRTVSARPRSWRPWTAW